MPLGKGISADWAELWAKYRSSGEIHGDHLGSHQEAFKKIAAILRRMYGGAELAKFLKSKRGK